MARRTPETLADYLVVAICPTLIGLLVGSLMYFLVGAFYRGEYQFTLLWVLTMFVIAIVGIARISMEEGMGYASFFGVPLAIALGLVIPKIGWPLLALVWWATHKLTWDCTLVDDTQDASGQGLLQHMGLDQQMPPTAISSPHSANRVVEPEAVLSDQVQPLPWWERLFAQDRRPHAPGVWVVYFSLAALPLFGIGGWFVAALAPEVRSHVFRMLVVYVGCGLALLLATSFLGLRRYLRQRKLEMPMEMTATWLAAGAVLIVATLLIAAILPRPRAEHSLSQVPFAVAWTVQKASRFAFLPEGIKDSSPEAAAARSKSQPSDESDQSSAGQSDQGSSGSRAESKSDQDGKGSGSAGKKSESSRGQQGQGASNDDRKGPSAGEKSDNSANKSRRANTRNTESTAQQQPPQKQNQSQPESPSRSPAELASTALSNIGRLIGLLVQAVFYIALAIAAVFLAWRYRDELLAAWRKLLAELNELWAGWFRTKPKPEVLAAQAPAPRQPKFSDFDNPFATGTAAGMSWPELVRYTFAAVEVWGRERQCPKRPDQTPLEFAHSLGNDQPAIAALVQTLAGSYCRLAYSPAATASGSREQLRELWQLLTAP